MLGLRPALAGLGFVRGEAFRRLVQRRAPGGGVGFAALGRDQALAGKIESAPRAARGFERGAFGRRCGAHRRLRALGFGALAVGDGAGLGGIALEVAEAVLLGKPARCRRGRVRRRREAVPAPQIALARDEPLAGPEPRPQGGAVVARDDADLRQPPLQRIRPLHDIRQRAHALGQGGVVGAVAVQRPMHRRRGGRGAFEILAERRAERGLVALRDGNEVEHLRPHVVGARGEELGEGADLGLEALRGALGVVCRTAAARLRLARAGKHVAGFGRALVGAAQRLLGGGERGGEILGRRARRGGLDRGEVALDAGALGGKARGALVLLAQAAIERAFSGVEVGDLRLQLAELGLDRGERRLGGVKARFRVRFRGFGAGAVAGELLALALEPRDRRGAVGLGGILAGDVALEIGDLALELLEALAGAALLRLELVPGVGQALQRRRRRGLGLAQGRERMRRDRLRRRGVRLRGLRVGDRVEVLAGLALGRRRLLARLGIADREQQRLEAADLGRDVLVARGLAALLLEAVDLGVDLAQHVVDAQEIVLGGFEPQLRLVTAGVQPGDAGRVLEDAAARLRLCRDDLADLALADERRRARPGRGVGEQQLHVAGPHLAAVDAVGRALLALDAARDVELRRVVERRRRLALLVVDREVHFRGVARRPVRRAGEDHVVHAGGAHALVRGLAHDPAQRLDEVRLAAAVRPDDAGEPRLDDEIGRLDEGS